MLFQFALFACLPVCREVAVTLLLMFCTFRVSFCWRLCLFVAHLHQSNCQRWRQLCVENGAEGSVASPCRRHRCLNLAIEFPGVIEETLSYSTYNLNAVFKQKKSFL